MAAIRSFSLSFLSLLWLRATQNHGKQFEPHKLQPQIMSTFVHLERSTGKISIVNFLNSECYSCMKALILNLFPTQYTLVIYIFISICSFTRIMTELPDNLQILTQCPLCTGCVPAQSSPTLWDPLDCRPPGSSGQARILDWAAFPPPRDLPNPEVKPASPASLALAGGSFTTEPPEKKHNDEQNARTLYSLRN